MVKIDEQGRLLLDKDVADFEIQINVSLPETYRDFLLGNNGGVPSPDVIDIEGVPARPTDVQVFFGIDRETETSTLAWNAKVFAKLLQSDGLLPIACDSGGNLFSVTVSGVEVGCIYYCLVDRPEHASCFVAQDIDGFLKKIRDWG